MVSIIVKLDKYMITKKKVPRIMLYVLTVFILLISLAPT